MLKQLPKPDFQIFEAFDRLNNDKDFERLKSYLFETAKDHIIKDFIVRSGDSAYTDAINKGALQVLEDLKYITANSKEWIGKTQQFKREA